MNKLQQTITKNYPLEDKINGFKKLEFDFNVSNELYRIDTAGKNYILKQMLSAESFFGSKNAVSRLEAVSNVIHTLNTCKLPVENILPTHAGNYLVNFEGSLLRLFEFIPGRQYSSAYLKKCIKCLHRLHSNSIEYISKDNLTELAKYSTALPLKDTIEHISFISEQLSKNVDQYPDFHTIIENMDLIKKSASKCLNYNYLTNLNPTILHTDFHPHNVIISDNDEPVMIDMDNLIYEKPYKCIAFSILRFSAFEKGINRNNFEQTLLLFLEIYGNPAGLKQDLLHTMTFLELEKILRILYRFFKTETYPHFIKNLVPLHLQNIKMIDQYKNDIK